LNIRKCDSFDHCKDRALSAASKMSWWDKDAAEGSDDEDGDGGEGEFNTTNDRIIFLIDGRAAMTEKNANGETHLQNSLTIALAVMKSKIIASGESSSIGLAFFGTKDRESTPEDTITSSNGVLTLFNLASPSAMRIRQLQNLIENPAELAQLVQPHPQALHNPSACPLKQALWTCSQSFGSNDYRKSDMKRIWIFTNDDNPNVHNPVEQGATLTVARDCAQAGIEISLWHIDPKNRSFDSVLFYMRLLRATAVGTASGTTTATTSAASDPTLPSQSSVVDADDADNAVQSRIIGAGSEGFNPQMASVRRKEHKKRRLGSVLFSLTCPCSAQASSSTTAGAAAGTGAGAAVPHLAVAMYKSIQVAKKPNHTWLYARSNEPIKVVSTYYDTATGEALTTDKIATFLECGAATESGQAGRVPLNADELKYIKTCGNDSGVGLQLLYFMPRAELKKDLNVESSYFLFPDDKSVKGSSLLFEALLRDLAAKVNPFSFHLVVAYAVAPEIPTSDAHPIVTYASSCVCHLYCRNWWVWCALTARTVLSPAWPHCCRSWRYVFYSLLFFALPLPYRSGRPL
jgi:ATP-dependent DNA helicase 2 subunit 1